MASQTKYILPWCWPFVCDRHSLIETPLPIPCLQTLYSPFKAQSNCPCPKSSRLPAPSFLILEMLTSPSSAFPQHSGNVLITKSYQQSCGGGGLSLLLNRKWAHQRHGLCLHLLLLLAPGSVEKIKPHCIQMTTIKGWKWKTSQKGEINAS